jgi:hypothetical protein
MHRCELPSIFSVALVVWQIDSILREGFNGMRDLLILDDKELANMMTAITRLPLNRGGHRIGAILTKKCKGLAYWCREQQRQGLDLDASIRFTEEELKGALERMAIEAIASKTKQELPSKFEAQKWVS